MVEAASYEAAGEGGDAIEGDGDGWGFGCGGVSGVARRFCRPAIFPTTP